MLAYQIYGWLDFIGPVVEYQQMESHYFVLFGSSFKRLCVYFTCSFYADFANQQLKLFPDAKMSNTVNIL